MFDSIDNTTRFVLGFVIKWLQNFEINTSDVKSSFEISPSLTDSISREPSASEILKRAGGPSGKTSGSSSSSGS